MQSVASVLFLVFLSQFWWFCNVGSRRIPVKYPGQDFKHFLYFFPMPETCPDECIYISECGQGESLASTNVSDPRYGHLMKNLIWFATGAGGCEAVPLLNTTYCSMTTSGECMIKCGGRVCAFPEHNGYERAHTEEDYERRVQEFRKINDTKRHFV